MAVGIPGFRFAGQMGKRNPECPHQGRITGMNLIGLSLGSLSGLLNALPGAVAQGLVWGIMAIGVYITYRVLDIADLTVDGSLCTGGAVCITMGKVNQAINVDKFDLLVSLRFVKGVPFYKNTIFLVSVIIVILILVLYWFFGTELGCSLRATGCNDKMARAQGINTDFSRVLGLMISNGIVALSGALLAQYQGFTDINMGRGAIVIGLAAVIIGEAVFGKVFHNFGLRLLAVAFGSIIYYFVLQIVIWLGIDTDLLKLLQAAVVAVFLAIPTWKSRYFTSPVRKASAGKGGNG